MAQQPRGQGCLWQPWGQGPLQHAWKQGNLQQPLVEGLTPGHFAAALGNQSVTRAFCSSSWWKACPQGTLQQPLVHGTV